MGRAISVRLDDEADRALRALEANGLSQSDAIRKALISQLRHQNQSLQIAAEVSALELDEDDRMEMMDIAEMMELFRAPG